jgi:hypothetical protein
MSKPGNYKIPFNKSGDQLHYADWFEIAHHGCVLQDNHEFEATLALKTMHRGRSAAYFEFERMGEGKTVTVFMTDLMDMFPHIHAGLIRGRFTFCKRGANFGCRLVEGYAPLEQRKPLAFPTWQTLDGFLDTFAPIDVRDEWRAVAAAGAKK